jgi:hypothetical protein
LLAAGWWFEVGEAATTAMKYEPLNYLIEDWDGTSEVD